MKSSRNIFTIIGKLIKFIIIVVVICTSVILFCGCRLINREVKDNNEIDVEGKSEDDLGKNNSVEELGEEEPQVDLIQNEIEAMSLEEKVGQMFIVGFDGYDVDDNIINLIKSKKVGGVILFSKNINTVNQTKKLIGSLNELNSKNKFKLFISVDEEGGIVSRIPKEIGQLNLHGM